MFDIEIQNETHQTQQRLKFTAVPRIGEGIRLLEPDGQWASYDVLDLWYQKAEYGEVWVPYLHVRMTPDDSGAVAVPPAAAVNRAQAMPIEEFLAKFEGPDEHVPTSLNLDMDD